MKLKTLLNSIAGLAMFTSIAACANPQVEILDDQALSIISADSKLTQLADGFKWTEGPLWVEDGGYLLFSDIPNNQVLKYSDKDGLSVFLEPSGATGIEPHDSKQGSNGLLLDDKGRLVLLQQGDRRVAVMDAPLSAPKSTFITLAGEIDGKRFNSPNDAVYHQNGDLYFTDPPYGLTGGADSPNRELDVMGIYATSPNGKTRLIDDSIKFPNGIGLSPDNKKMYVGVSDNKMPRWYSFDLDKDGNASNKQVLYDALDYKKKTEQPGYPDGMAVHSNGTIFGTGPGGVWVFTPEGKLLARILTGKATANCALSADEKTLFLTAHDVVYSFPIK
ncbi:SMP-30/gluconolactonase/LRE family protein [Agaribacter marinus]|uniref:Gluconolactonase n=1 Tax=Agaribacter marinus TaxID=1431249 RepID=A0AA37T192_9ALTE|nr:SMP-30/gluconolactonase/LRE family protein [Agaribacter marinus]GLR70508.1 gluconolactonase [Agaribacter marinus]